MQLILSYNFNEGQKVDVKLVDKFLDFHQKPSEHNISVCSILILEVFAHRCYD